MAPQAAPEDPDALARQFGGQLAPPTPTVNDPDALARQFGGTVSAATPTPKTGLNAIELPIFGNVGADVRALGRAAAGATRGAVRTVQTIASPLRKAFGMAPATPPPGETTTAGKVGRFAEEVGEFALGGKAVTAGAKALNVAGRLVRAGVPAARAAMAGAAAEGVGQGAAAYGITKTQGKAGAGTAAAISAALPVAGAGAKQYGPTIIKNAAAKMQAAFQTHYKPSEIADPVNRINRITAEAAQDALNIPITRTWKDWINRTQGVRTRVGQSLEATLQGPAGDVKHNPQEVLAVLDQLKDARAQHLVRVSPGGRTYSVFDKPLANAVDTLKETIASSVDGVDGSITTRQLHDIKRVWWKAIFPVAEGKNPLASIADQLTSAQKEARLVGSNAIVALLERDNPTIAQLDNAVSHAIGLNQMVKNLADDAAKESSQAMRWMFRSAGAGVGIEVARSTGAPGVAGYGVGAAAGFAAARALESVLNKNAWALVGPQKRAQIAQAIITGKGDRVLELLRPFLAQTMTSPRPSTGPTPTAPPGASAAPTTSGPMAALRKAEGIHATPRGQTRISEETPVTLGAMPLGPGGFKNAAEVTGEVGKRVGKAAKDILERRVLNKGVPSGISERRLAELMKKFGGTQK